MAITVDAMFFSFDITSYDATHLKRMFLPVSWENQKLFVRAYICRVTSVKYCLRF